MSIKLAKYPPHCLVAIALFVLADARAQSVATVRLQVEPSVGVRVVGESARAVTDWSFRQARAGIGGIAERVGGFRLRSDDGEEIGARRLAAGEYRAERPARRFEYEVRLKPMGPPENAAHLSWLTAEHGLLILDDLLPTTIERAKIDLSLPIGWQVFSTERERDGAFEVERVREAVFVLGVGERLVERRVKGMRLSLVIAGTWPFRDDELADQLARVIEAQEKAFGARPRANALVSVAPFPAADSAQRWSAETLGGTVIFLARADRSPLVLPSFAVSLAHELFHLWVPNGLGLTGEYAWFYEGFTLYQAMRIAQRVELLTFQDYLRALERAYNAYLSSGDDGRQSLVETSKRRWAGTNALLYNKGMLIAFLYDLMLRQRTKNRLTLDELYRRLFRRYGMEEASGTAADGNEAALEILRVDGMMADIVARFIERPAVISLAELVAPFGLRTEAMNGRVRLMLSDELSSSQRELWRELGYNPRADVSPRKRERRREF